MIDEKPFRMKNEAVKNWAKTTYEVPKDASIKDICFSVAFTAAHEMASDLLDARELIDKQKAIINEMREEISIVVSTASSETTKSELSYISNYTEMRDLLKKTKGYA